MPRSRPPVLFLLPLLSTLAVLVLSACGDKAPARSLLQPAGSHPVLGVFDEVVLDEAGGRGPTPGSRIDVALKAVRAATVPEGAAALVVDYPFDGTVFPPGFVSPTFLWHDDSGADTWWIEVAPSDGEPALEILVPGDPPPQAEVDERAIGKTNEIYEPTPYQASARSWTPEREVWTKIQTRSKAPATIAIRGFAAGHPSALLSQGSIEVTTSVDEVGAPIFYRDVPLMPSVGEKGKIQPLGKAAIPLIQWRLKDVTREDSRVVLTDMPSCANCHSFSRDGRTLGMDIDGPDGDKGTYAIAPIQPSMSLDYDDLITWNSFEDKPTGHKTIGFLSRVSPDGRYAITTLNEELYVSNFPDYKFIQVFYPTRGILAVYDTRTKTMRALPGADDTEYVQCDPAWSPDGKTIVFARAKARDPYTADIPRATYPNDPNEPQVHYDLYRIPFDGGRGGTPVAIEGAGDNGMSNTFPKVSPDGKWVVYAKCRNGQLLRPDSRLWIVPLEGGEARELESNLEVMNSWHSFSPNGRWLVFSSKTFTPYTQMFLTHLDEGGHATPAVLVPNATAANRAVNLPEFLNAPYDALKKIDVPAVKHRRYFLMGTRSLEHGDAKGALANLKKALELEPDFARAHVNYGFALMRMGRREEAFQHFEKAVEISPSDAFALTNYAAAMLEVDRVDDALHYARRALDRGEDNASANYTYGQALIRAGNTEEAIVHLRRALQTNPDLWQARRTLAFALRESGQSDAARHEFEAVLAVRPKDEQVQKALDGMREP